MTPQKPTTTGTASAYVVTPEMTAATERYFTFWATQRKALTKLDSSPGVLFSSIALVEEAPAIADMSDEEIHKIPPIILELSTGITHLGDEYDRYAPGDISVKILGDSISYRVVDLCSGDKTVITALDKLCEYRQAQSALSKVDIREARKAWLEQRRSFARIFWNWYERQQSEQHEAKEPRIEVDPITGNLTVCSGLMEQGVLGSIPNAKGAKPIENPLSTRGTTWHRLKQRQGTVEISFLAENLMKLQEVDDYTSDTILIHIDRFRNFRDEYGLAWMTAESMFNSRGIKSKTKMEGSITYSSGYRPEDYEEAYRRVQQLEDFWITVQSRDVWNPNKSGNVRKKRQDITEGRLITIVLRKRLTGEGGHVYAWKFRLFDGLEELVNDDSFAYVSSKILGYDYYRQIPEKRIGLYTAIHFRINNMKAIHRVVGTLIESCRLTFDKKRPNRFIERFHKALNKLVEDGVLREWNYLVSGKVDKDGKLIDNPKLSKNVGDLGLDARGFWGDYIKKKLWLEPNPDIPKVKRKGDDPRPVTSSPTKPALSA